MLQHIGLHQIKSRIENALIETLKDGVKTRDIGGKAGTMEFAEAIINHLEPPAKDEFKEPFLLRIFSDLLPTHTEVAEDCHGIDIFVENPNGIPKMPEQVGKLKLKMISNRGTKIYPG